MELKRIRKLFDEYIESQKNPDYINGKFRNTILGIPSDFWVKNPISVNTVMVNDEYRELCRTSNIAPTPYYRHTIHSYVLACAEFHMAHALNKKFFMKRAIIFGMSLLAVSGCIGIKYLSHSIETNKAMEISSCEKKAANGQVYTGIQENNKISIKDVLDKQCFELLEIEKKIEEQNNAK